VGGVLFVYTSLNLRSDIQWVTRLTSVVWVLSIALTFIVIWQEGRQFTLVHVWLIFKSSSIFRISEFTCSRCTSSWSFCFLHLCTWTASLAYSWKKVLVLNWQPSPTNPRPLDLQLPSLLMPWDPIILFVPEISCFSSGFLLKLLLVHVPFILQLILLFGIYYLILSGRLLLYLLLNKLYHSSFTSCLHPCLRFYFRHWRVTNLYLYCIVSNLYKMPVRLFLKVVFQNK